MYKDWINEIDIKVDYYSAFIKAWIAFNSWYRAKYSDKQDKEIIEKIKSQNNEFKNYIKSLLNSSDDESKKFKNSIGNLHLALLKSAIMTQERSATTEQISFANIAMVNTKNTCDESYRFSRYILKRTNSGVEIQILNRNNPNNIIFQLSQAKYNVLELESNNDFKRLSPETRSQLKYFYKEIHPYTVETIIKKDKSSNDRNIFSDIHFVDNNEKIAIALIDVLYLLRCSLMHGQVSPDNNSMEVYKYSYEILSAILKKMM